MSIEEKISASPMFLDGEGFTLTSLSMSVNCSVAKLEPMISALCDQGIVVKAKRPSGGTIYFRRSPASHLLKKRWDRNLGLSI